jgi:hypothetical protein
MRVEDSLEFVEFVDDVIEALFVFLFSQRFSRRLGRCLALVERTVTGYEKRAGNRFEHESYPDRSAMAD